MPLLLFVSLLVVPLVDPVLDCVMRHGMHIGTLAHWHIAFFFFLIVLGSIVCLCACVCFARVGFVDVVSDPSQLAFLLLSSFLCSCSVV